MNILIRKLIFNESDIHLILWKDKPCFLVSELSKALDSVNKEDIPVFLRYGENAVKGVDYDVVSGTDARDLRSYLENSGIKKRFAHTMVIYFEGLKKYLNYRKTIEMKDFVNYLIKSKISFDTEASPVTEAATTAATTAATVLTETAVPAKPAPLLQVPAPKKQIPPTAKASTPYSDFLKHISFMEEFVEAFNQIHITPDKSVAFTKSMVQFLEDNGMQSDAMLKEIKKWIV